MQIVPLLTLDIQPALILTKADLEFNAGEIEKSQEILQTGTIITGLGVDENHGDDITG